MNTARNEYLLRFGDNALILSQRLGEWCGKGPALEEDMALTNVALDLLGQARMWLSYAAQLQGDGVLLGVEIQVARDVAVDQGPGRHHFRVEQRVAAEQAMEVTAVPVRPVHHRGDGQAAGWQVFFRAHICKGALARPIVIDGREF